MPIFKNKYHKLFASIMFITLAVFYQTLAMAWDNNITHPGLTNKAVDLLTSTNPSYLYLQKYAHFNLATDTQLTFLDEGSVKEDYGLSADWNTALWGSQQDNKVPSLSWKSHGYHPISGEVWYGLPDIDDNAYVYSDDIWSDIVSSDNPFFHIGRLSHLIEDMASIAHANADQHVSCDDLETFSASNYTQTNYNPQTVRKPSVDGLTAQSGYPHPNMVADTHGNYMLNVVWRAYYMSTFYAGDLVVPDAAETSYDVAPDSELKRMFPYNGGTGLRYDDGGFWTNDSWAIDDVGNLWIGWGWGINPDWWSEDGGLDPGYYYLENIDGDDDSCTGAGATPEVFKIDKFNRVLPSDDLNEVLATNTKPLTQLFIENMYPLAAEWVAGFIQYASDNVEKAHPDSGDVNGDGDINLIDAITSLKILSGIPGVTVNVNAEVTGDNKVGLGETVYIMEVVAGARD